MTGTGAGGQLTRNIAIFARALREAGVRTGPADLATAVRAAEIAGLGARGDLRAALRAALISRRDDLEIFDQIFARFWRDPDFLGKMMHLAAPLARDARPEPQAQAAARRAEDALAPPATPDDLPARDEVTQEALFTAASTARLQSMDFEQMSAAELAEAAEAVRQIALGAPPLRTRRPRPSAQGRPAPRATLARALRRGGEIDRIDRRAPGMRPPDLVALVDISGSMSIYARMILRLIHAMAHTRQRRWGQVHAFTFATELTPVTRALRQPDPDVALAAIGTQAQDWTGGTRIGAALARFNRDWARRVLGQGAVVLLVSDGLERDPPEALARAAAHLSRRAQAIVWLNPLLRFEGFEPQARGIQALLPHVTSLRACHSLDSLADLAAALGPRPLSV